MSMVDVKSKLKIAVAAVFVAAEIVLYALFLAEDFGGADVGDNVWLKYATVVLAFAFALTSFAFVKKADKVGLYDAILLSLALALTLTSDWFLLVQGDFFEIALITFICAQLCHFARIGRTKLWLVISIVLRLVLPTVIIAVLASLGELSGLYALVAIYFVQLVMNFAENVALAIVAKDRAERIKAIILSLGFLLFIGCDICVGCMNLYGEAGELIWLFYTPSQVLIALSWRRNYESTTD